MSRGQSWLEINSGDGPWVKDTVRGWALCDPKARLKVGGQVTLGRREGRGRAAAGWLGVGREMPGQAWGEANLPDLIAPHTYSHSTPHNS